jgi:colanic acid/amylovoran biosynthesis glycosyltransferase
MMPTVLVYRDVLLPASEMGFMRRQYVGFSRLRPLWVGRHLTPAAAGLAIHRLGGEAALGPLRRALFKEFGLVPDAEALRAHNPAVVHAQFGRGGALALPLARALNLPLVVTFHGGDAHKDKHYRSGFPPGVFARRLPALMAEAKAFICVSESVRDRLITRGFPEDKLRVLPIGTDIPPDAIPRQPGGPLLFVGRFVPKKGLSVLIEALHQLRAQDREPDAAIIGDGPLAPAIRRQAEGLARLRFLGWQTPEAVMALMRSAALLAVPSVMARGGDAEGLPSVAMEAMAAGLPVIASDQAGLGGVVIPGETGVIATAGDPAAWAAAIAMLMADPAERGRLGEAATRMMRCSFDAAIQSRKLEELLLDVTF